jgi:Asp-tRNA(Asn)/Glu-tRNA(Gln) amidotransferase A subunit family amidase
VTSLFLAHSIPGLLHALRDGSLTPAALACEVARVVALREPETLAWVDFDAAPLLAAATEHRGATRALDGIPFGAKDIFNTVAFPTQMGSPIWKGFTPGNNARVVHSLLHAGALVAGKTVTAEFAVHALNATLNPHDPTRTPGTSSSGSAAAVAAGMVPFALASQTAGSIVRPASFCGVWGMKPSFGMIPRTGMLKTTDSLDTVGVVAAHAESLRPLLDVMRVRGPNYPFVYRNVDAAGEHPKPAREPWRVGMVQTSAWATAADYARHAIDDLAARIGRVPDVTVIPLDEPSELRAAHEIHTIIYAKSLSYYFRHEAQHVSDVSPIMRRMIEEGDAISTGEFRAALRRQEELAAAVDTMLSTCDFALSLGTSSAAPLRGVDELPDPSLLWTLAHVPAVAAPVFRAPDGMPFGAQFVARRWGDYRLLQGIEALVGADVLPAGSTPVTRWA